MLHADRSSSRSGWMLLMALVIMLPYTLTLRMPFDFDDDGCLVYPSAGPLRERCLHFWRTSVSEFTTRGPFRPVTWVAWNFPTQLFGTQPVWHHLIRLCWGVAATWLLLQLLRELCIDRWIALLVAAAAMWNPVRSEVWISLGLTESIGMPFAMFALWAAVRAGTSPRPWRWDVAGFVAVVAALGCKNTFAVIVPVQLLLRAGSGDTALWIGLRSQVSRLCLLSLSLLLPVGHFLLLQWDKRPREYSLVGWGPMQLLDMSRAVLRAGSLEYLAPGLVLMALFAWRFRASDEQDPASRASRMHRIALLAGGLLIILGIGIYWPIQAVAGRYSMPAVWGLDLCLAVVLHRLTAIVTGVSRRMALGLVCLGLGVLLVVMVQREHRQVVRCEMLWEALEYVEARAEPGCEIGWQGLALFRQKDVELLDCEGVHFRWHLEHRGHRPDLHVQLVRLEKTGPAPALMFCGGRNPPPGAGWVFEREFHRGYRMGLRQVRCSLWSRVQGDPS